MNRQNFINSHGRFPVSTEALSFLQNQILAVHDFVQVAGPFAIIKDSTAVAAGLAVVNGELMPLLAAATSGRNFIQVVTQTESVDAGGLHFADVRVTRTAVYRSAQQGNECYAVSSFTNISTIADIMSQISTINTAISGLASAASVSQLAALLEQLDESLTTKEGALTTLIGNKGVPVGSITMWGGATAPTNWHLCDGTHFSKSQYPELYAAIGHTYGGYAEDDFCLPDMRGRYVAGKGANDYNTLGAKGGANAVALVTAEMPSHTHGRGTLESTGSFPSIDKNSQTANYSGAFKRGVLTDWSTNLAGGGNSDNWGARINYKWSDGASGSTGSTGSGQSHENRPPFIVMNYIIKVR